MKRLALDPLVLSNSGPKMFAVKARSWSDSSHLFLKRCADAESPEASYTLGMIRFYCLQNWSSGASLMAKAAVKSHALALYSLAVIQFNGSGGGGGSKSKNKKNLPVGVALCQRAARLGHLNALRELGHCVQDGYGSRRTSSSNIFGRRQSAFGEGMQSNPRRPVGIFSRIQISDSPVMQQSATLPLPSSSTLNSPGSFSSTAVTAPTTA